MQRNMLVVLAACVFTLAVTAGPAQSDEVVAANTANTNSAPANATEHVVTTTAASDDSTPAVTAEEIAPAAAATAGPETSVEAAPANAATTDTGANTAIVLESSSVDLFADVLVVNDIGGKVDGVYDDANAELLSAVVTDAKHILANKLVFADTKLSNGLLLGDVTHLVYAKDGKATAVIFEGHATEDSVATLAPKQSMQFFTNLINNDAVTPSHNFWAGRDRPKKHAADFPVMLPTGGLGGSSRYLLFVQASARHIPMGKSFGIAMATGLASGGNYMMMLMSGGSVNVALVDKQSSQVLWAMQRPVRDFNAVQIVAMQLVRALSRALPAISGGGDASITANKTADSSEYHSLFDAKVALRAGTIDRTEYDRVAAVLESQYHEVLKDLTQKKLSGEISDAAFDILSVKSKLDYTGAASG